MEADIIIYKDDQMPFRNWTKPGSKSPTPTKSISLIFYHHGKIMFEWMPRNRDIPLIRQLLITMEKYYDGKGDTKYAN